MRTPKPIEISICSMCFEEYEIYEFMDERGRLSHTKCKDCRRAISRERVRKSRAKKKAAIKKSIDVLYTTDSILTHIATQSGLTCADCGYNRFPSAIRLINVADQDALHNAIRVYILDSSDANWAVINNLLIGCIPVCKNCLSGIPLDIIATLNPISPTALPIKSPRKPD